MVTRESFGSLVRRYRRDAELTQEALAELAGLSVRAIRDIETGSRHQPRHDTVDLLLAALDVPIEEQAAFRDAAAAMQLDQTVARDGGDASTPGAAHVLTILIADLRGYTAYTVEHGDEAGARLAQQFAASTRVVVEAFAGKLQELRGDEALCVFPSARQALRAALALQERYHGDGTGDGLPLGAGIGLDAGEAIPVGDGYRGSALNLAARLCALAGPGEVLASEAVSHLARALEGIHYSERGAVNLKGFGEPLRVIEILPADPSPTREDVASKDQPLPIGGFLGALPANPLAGRQNEVERVEAALDRVADGTGQFLVLSGGPGFGKTRLAQEATILARDRGFLLATGRCYAAEQDSLYSPFIEALAMAFAGAPRAVRREVTSRWPHLGRLLPADVVPVPTLFGSIPEERHRLTRAVNGELSLPRIKTIARQAAAALASAHGKAIVHRDIKPDNLMVLDGDQVKVTDFGIARILRPDATVSTMQSTGMSLGTPLYMAPEQIEGRKVDGRADIYSLGAVLYHLVTGRPPFEGTDPVTIAYKHVHEAPTPPSEVSADVPADWEALILRALAKDPDDRFRTAGELEAAIAALSTEPRSARQAGGRRARIPTPVPRARASTAPEVQPVEAASPGGSPEPRAASPSPPRDAVLPAPAGTRRLIPRAHRVQLPLSTRPLRAMLVAAALLILLIAGLAWHTLSAGSPSYAFGRADPTWSRPPPHFGPFTSPEAIATDSHGGVFVAEIADVRELSSSGDPLQAWGSHGTGSGQFELPDSIGVASDGNLFVADTQLDRVKELTASGRLLRQWSVTPAPGIPSPTPCYPEPGNDEVISLDRSNRLYVVDGRSNRVKTYSASGRLLGGWTTPAEAGPGAGSAPLCGIVAGVHHDVYVMSVAGYIDHYSAAGRLLGRLGSPGSGPGQLRYTTALCADRRGDVYVADVSNAQVGSEGLEARVQEFNAHGAAVRSWGGLTQHPETLPLIAGLALDDRGNILALSPAETAILKLGSGGRVLARWNGASRSAPTRFEEPTGIAVDSQGSIYVSDPANGKVVRLSSEGAPVSTFAGPTAASRRFSPWFLAVGPNGEIYAAAPFDDRIDEFGPGGSFLRSVAEAGTEPMQLSNPFGVVVARDGSLYITDHGNSRIVELSPAGKELAVYSLPQGGSGEVAYFANGITMDREGNLYVTVQRSTNAAFFRGRYPDQVLKLSSDLKLLSSWGKTGSGPGELSMPGGIAVDGQGHVLVADSGNNRVVAFSADGRFLSQLKDGFSQPSAVAVDAKGDVYVADTGNDRVVKFLPGH